MVVRYLILPYADINPKTRYTAEQALNHPWVNGSNVKANNLLQSPRQIKKIMEKHNAKFGSSVGVVMVEEWPRVHRNSNSHNSPFWRGLMVLVSGCQLEPRIMGQ